jgi:hypothetical protein
LLANPARAGLVSGEDGAVWSISGLMTFASAQRSRVIAYFLRIRIFICQQLVEPIGGIQQPGRSPDRNGKAVCRKLAGQYYRNDGAGTDVGGVVIVFYRFDDECHVVHRLSQAIR